MDKPHRPDERTILLVRINCPSETTGQSIAEAAISAKLAACANLEGPVASIYPWKGEIVREDEWILWLKTAANAWDPLEALIKTVHPYEVPAILGFDSVQAHAPFAAWITNEMENSDAP
ncbi:MAG: divalent-cation tolerance protein CutA [Pseudomonadota bacterium]